MIIYIKYEKSNNYNTILDYSINEKEDYEAVEIHEGLFYILNNSSSTDGWYYNGQQIIYNPNLNKTIFFMLDKNNVIEAIGYEETPNSVKSSYTTITFEKEYKGIDITNGKYKYLNNQIIYNDELPLGANELRTLRTRRESECFLIINRGQLWYAFLTAEQLQELKSWYQAWLDITETGVIPEKPSWLGDE